MEYSLGALEIRKIGVDKYNPPNFIKEICDLMGFNNEVKEHLLQYTGFQEFKEFCSTWEKDTGGTVRRNPLSHASKYKHNENNSVP